MTLTYNVKSTTQSGLDVYARTFMERQWGKLSTNERWITQIIEAQADSPVPFVWRIRKTRRIGSRGNAFVKGDADSFHAAIRAVHDYMVSLDAKF